MSVNNDESSDACETYLQKHPDSANRISLYNHDSFTTTGKVVLPAWLTFLADLILAHLRSFNRGNFHAGQNAKNFINRLLGGNLDETAEKFGIARS